MKWINSWWAQTTGRLALAPILSMTLAVLPANSAEAATILVFGDSISAGYGIQREQGWVSLLRGRLAERLPQHQVVNASVSGETTSGGAVRLPAALQAHDPEVLIIELGGNDGLRGHPVAEIKKNLGRMIELANPAQREVLVVAMHIPPNYGPRYAQAFAALFGEVAADFGVPLVASFIDSVALNPALMQDDGIHPNAAAQPALLEAVWPVLAPLLD